MVSAIGNDTNFYGNLYGSGTEVKVSDILDGNDEKKQPSACELFSNGKRYEKIRTADPLEALSVIEDPKYDDGKVRVIEYTGPEIVMLDSTSKDGAVTVAGKWVLRSRSQVTFAMNIKTTKSIASGADDNFLAVVPRDDGDDGADGTPCGGNDPGIRIGGGVNSLHNVALMSKDISTTFSNNILAIDGYVVADKFTCLRKNVNVARFSSRAGGILSDSNLLGDADGTKDLYDQYLKK